MEVFFTILFFTAIWAAVGLGGPSLVSKEHQQDLVRCIFLLTAVCCWLFWLCCYLAQLNPLIGPKLTQDTVRLIAKAWNHPITEG
ncbi:V-type proton ATPase subunit e [Drosophila madeirensis]|uniref:V-type proton ATPase subunit n=2 Tax=obscura subgroup TaxID=32357 RepID=A0A3B0J683_DROGU|nr:V-type proton ATPase subunit e [Drosophila guanche]XP_034658785.1 V-type proton ATPase subunit e [Drosophila subobscura]SPP77447.1 blast:V-type proton ATPase subunit e [Drosophila guanche]